MKKIFGLILCLAFVSMVFASHADRHDIVQEIKDPNPPLYVEGVMRSTGGPDDFGYVWIDSDEPGGPVYNWIEINATGTNMNLTDDSHFWPIPFTFDFYGVTYNNIAVGSNGTVYFQDAYLGYSNTGIPSTNGYNVHEYIAVYWDDLNPSSGGAVYYEIMGDLLVVEWDNVPHFGGGGNVTCQAILDGSDGSILLQYLDPSPEAGSGATVGIQGSPTQPPLWGLQYSYDQAVLTAGLAIWFGVGGMGPSILYVDDDDDVALSGYFEGSFSNLGYAYDMWVVTDSGDVTPTAAQMGAYDIVVWTTGEDYSTTLPGNDTLEIAAYLNGGGKMWFSSQDILWDQGAVGFLHVGSYVSDIGCSQATGVGPVTSPISFPTTGGAIFDYSDEVQPDGVTWAEMQNETATNNTIAMDSPYYLFFNGFAFENINNAADRDSMMYRVIEWLGAPPPSHDVGCFDVVSPPAGPVAPGNYDVIGWIRNVGNQDETFDVVANVYDTVGMTNIFNQTINLTLTAGADTNLDFGQVTFGADMYFYTEIYTMLAGDIDPSNDTSSVYSRTAIGFPDVVFELDAQAVANDNQLLGIEFDGTYFYVTGGGNAADPNKVYVMDTAGTLMWTLDQPAHSTGWGWRDVAWDDVYAGPDRIDTLYASVNPNVDKFSIDLTGGNLVYHGFFPGAQSPNRALAYYPDSGWFYTANFSSSCYKFNKAGVILQNVPNTYAMYGAAYDGEGDFVWWFSQDDPGTGFLCQISQMDPYTMTFTGLVSGFAMPAALTDAIAGGMCYYHGFRGNMDVLFCLLQGTPNDYIVGVLVRTFVGIEGKPGAQLPLAFGFAPSMATVSKGHLPIAYTTSLPGHVSLKVYDGMGRLVQTLVNTHQAAGEKSVYWDNKDLSNRTVANGVYFLKLEANDQTAVHKLIFVR